MDEKDGHSKQSVFGLSQTRKLSRSSQDGESSYELQELCHGIGDEVFQINHILKKRTNYKPRKTTEAS